jgi:hypothetical protein
MPNIKAKGTFVPANSVTNPPITLTEYIAHKESEQELGEERLDSIIKDLRAKTNIATESSSGTVKSAGKFVVDLSDKEANVYVKEDGTMYADINEDNLDLDGYITDDMLDSKLEEINDKILNARPPLATAYEAGIVKSAEEALSIQMTIDISE